MATETKVAVAPIKERIERILGEVDRPGMDVLKEYLESNGFYESPASARYHSVYPGGLAQHSLRVYELLRDHNELLKLGVNEEHIIIAGLLHDVCKLGAYISDGNGKYRWNKMQPPGHAVLSIERISRHIELTDLEDKMIRFHMGVYGLKEFDADKGEYVLRGGSMANVWYYHPIVKVMYFCDEIATLEEKAIRVCDA